MLIVGNTYNKRQFQERYQEYYNATRYYDDKKLEGLASLHYYLKTEYKSNGNIYTEEEIIEMVKNLVIMEAHDLYAYLTDGKYYYGQHGLDLIEKIMNLLEKTRNIYIDYIQVGVRKEQLIVFIG